MELTDEQYKEIRRKWTTEGVLIAGSDSHIIRDQTELLRVTKKIVKITLKDVFLKVIAEIDKTRSDRPYLYKSEVVDVLNSFINRDPSFGDVKKTIQKYVNFSNDAIEEIAEEIIEVVRRSK